MEIKYPNWLPKIFGSPQTSEEMNGIVEVLQNHAETLSLHYIRILAASSGIYTDALTPSSEVPTEVGDKVFLVTEPGTYTNFGNVVLPENNFGFIFKNGNNFSIQSVEMPMQDLTTIENKLTEIEENVLKTYTLSSSTESVSWQNVVEDIYINTNGLGGNYKITYIMKNYLSYGKIGVQIADINNETNVGTYFIDFAKKGAILKLNNYDENEYLNKAGVEVFISFKNYEEFGDDSYLYSLSGTIYKTAIDNSSINLFGSRVDVFERVSSPRTFDVENKVRNADANIIFNLVQDIFILDKKDNLVQDFAISVIWINNSDRVAEQIGRFGFQIVLDNKFPSNYGITFNTKFEDLKKNTLIEMQPQSTSEPLAEDLKVFIVFKSDVEYPEQNLFIPTTIPWKIFNNNSSISNFKKQFDYYLPSEIPTLIKPISISENEIEWRNLIKNIWIVDTENNDLSNSYEITYIWLNNDNPKGKFGFQLTRNGIQPSNFSIIQDISSGEIVEISTTSKNEPLANVKIFIEFIKFSSFPTKKIFEHIDSVNYFTNEAFSLKKSYEFLKKLPSITDVNINSLTVSEKENGVNAIQNAINSITDNSSKNIYNIQVKSGIYKITNSSQFIGYPGYPSMILAKDYVNIIGDSKNDCIVWAELPYNDAEIDTNIDRNLHQTLYNWAECTIENITFVGKNLRYVLHQDNPNESHKTRYYKNCDFLFYGNKGSVTSLGIGTWSGSKTYVEGGRSYSDVGSAFACHNNQVFSTPSKWSFNGHTFATLNSIYPITLQNSGSLIGDVLNLENCKLEGGFVLNYMDWWIYTPNVNDHFNHANWRVIGSGNEAMLFNNNVNGKSLKIEASTIGKNIRFDKTSSAYNIIISNQYDYFGNLGHPERKIVDKYIVFDATIGLKSYAIGGKSIREYNYIFGTVISEDSLGKRLGDCSVINKVLGVIIGNETVNIVFNKNYTAFTNAQIINEINTSLNGKAIASEYNVGADYYAEFTDVNYVLYNNSSTDFIPKNTLVTKIGNKIAVAQENDIVFGLAIDDIHPLVSNSDGSFIGKGRVIRNCIVKNNSLRLSNGVSIQRNKKYSSNNGELVENINGDLIGYDNDYLLIK